MRKSTKQKIIVIVGPTASGKSDLAIKLAKKFNGEIISADSRQVYRGMDIGTGKVLRDKTFPVPNSKFKNQNSKFRNNFYSSGIQHHLIDVASPKKQFTADNFKKLGQKAIKDILSRGKIPIIVGGTGFYIDVLLGRISIAEVPPDKKLRAKLEKQSAEQLFKQLKKLDPRRTKTIEPKNKRRLIRAMEIAIATAKSQKQKALKPHSSTQHDRGILMNYEILWLGLNPGKEKLAKKIKKRLDMRLKQGMLREIEKLSRQGISWKRLDELGLEYRWTSRWLKNKKITTTNNKSFSNSQEYKNLLRDIIKYSKRQMTWFKRNPNIKWGKSQRAVEKLLVQFLR